MRLLTYSLTLSLDGYVMDADGGIDWAAPDAEVFRYATDEVRRVAVRGEGGGPTRRGNPDPGDRAVEG